MSDVEMKVTYDGRSMYCVVRGDSIVDGLPGGEESVVRCAGLEVKGALGRLMGPTDGIGSFQLGDMVVNREGEQETVYGIDRHTSMIGLKFQGPIDEPIAQWRPMWTIPDSERK